MSALKWEKVGDTYRAHANTTADRWYTITPGGSSGPGDKWWHLRGPDGVGTAHGTLAEARAEARACHNLGIR